MARWATYSLEQLGMSATRERIEDVFAQAQGRVLATLTRVVGDLDLAEDSLQEAFSRALEVWPTQGIPDNPLGWITTAARNRLIDRIRRAQWIARKAPLLRDLALLESQANDPAEASTGYPDDRLRLIFTCCHPALAREAQVALTLKTLGGLTTAEIARAYLVAESTLAQRLVRVKRKIRSAGIPYEVPAPEHLAQRTGAVLEVLYLIFNEGYFATSGDALVRHELSNEAIRLARLLVELLPCDTEVQGLLALMLLHDARRPARTDSAGELIALEDQDRSQWNADGVREGTVVLERALADGASGPYVIQAAISALHSQAVSSAETDWAQISVLYQALLRFQPSPVAAINQAVAVAMAEGPNFGLKLLDRLAGNPRLTDYQPLHAARADLLRRAALWEQAAAAYRRAIDLSENDPQRRFLRKRLNQLNGVADT